MDTEKPTVYVIAGPNGAGKTTFSSEFLPDFVHCREFLNADLIAAGLSPFAPETQAMPAGRLLLKRIQTLFQKKQTFAFETTLAGRGYARLLRNMRDSGYRVVLFFLWLPDPETANNRVHERVSQGGHFIPEDVVIRRYRAGLYNLFHLYRDIPYIWRIYNSASLPPQLIAHTADNNIQIFDTALLQKIQTQAGVHNGIA